MKFIKTLFWIIVLALLGVLIYQNQPYFMASSALQLDLKISGWKWTFPPFQNIAYLGICFALGLLLTGIKCIFLYFDFKKQINKANADISGLQKEITALNTELQVFTHDPYIKKGLEQQADGALIPETLHKQEDPAK